MSTPLCATVRDRPVRRSTYGRRRPPPVESLAMATFDELLQATDEVLTDGARRGAMHNLAQDERLDGRTVTVHGKRLLNFGSCSYLGLETHPALTAAVVQAANRFGS